MKNKGQKPRPVGRPRFGREAMTVYLPIRLTPTQKAFLESEALAWGVSEADVIRAALDAYAPTRIVKPKGKTPKQ